MKKMLFNPERHLKVHKNGNIKLREVHDGRFHKKEITEYFAHVMLIVMHFKSILIIV